MKYTPEELCMGKEALSSWMGSVCIEISRTDEHCSLQSYNMWKRIVCSRVYVQKIISQTYM